MSKIRNLPESTSLNQDDLLYVVDSQVGSNGGKKVKVSTVREAVELTDAEVKTKYENNADTNAFTDAEKTKLAGIETGATADQDADEVPYSNTASGLSATDVQAAIDEVATEAQADFRSSIVSGRILHYTGGTARFDGIFYELLPGDILLNPNVTLGEVYVDLDGIVKQTGSGVLAPPYTIVFAQFSTDLNDITSLTDERVKNAQNIVRGTLADVRDVRAGAAAAEGTSGRVSDAMHKHNVLTAAAVTQTPDQANAEGTSTSLARADHVHAIPAGTPSVNLSPASANSKGVAASFALSDHSHAIETSLDADISTIEPDDAAAAGTEDSFARGDHKHAIVTDAAVTQTPEQANAEGVSTSFARADHVHNIPTDAPTTALSPATSNAEGVGSSFSRNDHTHSVATALVGDISSIEPDDVAAAGTANTYARGDHRHAIATDVPVTQNPDQSNAEGVSTSFSRADHVHNIPAASAVGLDAASANAEGVSTSFARADHTHDLSTGAASSQAPDQANAEGSSANLARADHVHNIPADAPTTTLSPATSNAEGVGASFARNDHTHAVATALVGDISTIQPDDAAAAGVANTYARGDHKHAIVAAAPGNTGTANAEGVSTSFARADHTHNTVIANSVASATADDTTTSATDVLIASMTLTPAAGTYLVTFSTSALNSGNGASRMFFSIYSGGSQVTHSEREIGISGGANQNIHTNAVVTVNGAEAIEARWRAVAGTNTAHERSLTLIRLG